jgi:hypothetical protein
MARMRITLDDPSRFRDPANLTWERCVALQSRERERYLAERAAIPRETLEYQTVGPRYLARAVEQFANNYFPELASLRLFCEVAKGGGRHEWWDGFLASYYEIALPLGLRATPLSL